MAVTLTTAPDELCALYNPIRFGLTISDVGSGTITKKIAYRVLGPGGTPIGKDEAKPFVEAGTELFVDIRRDVMAYVRTAIPPNRTDPATLSNLTLDDDIIIEEVGLEFGELVFDSDDNSTTITWASTHNIKILNSALQRDELTYFSGGESGFYLLTDSPFDMDAHIGHREYVWLYGAFTVEHKVIMNHVDFVVNTGSSGINSSTATIGYTPICFGKEDAQSFLDQLAPAFGLAGLGAIGLFQTQIIQDGNTYIFNRRVNCHPTDENYKSIMFLEPKGGRGSISFKIIDGLEVSSEFTEICRYNNPNQISSDGDDYKSNITVGGKTIIDKKSKDTIVLKVSSQCSIDIKQYFVNFLGSPGYHIIDYEIDGTALWKKFILNSGSVRYYKEDDSIDLTITGYISHEHNKQYMDR